MKKTLSVFSLAMINVIAIDSLRTLPLSAKYGYAVIFYYFMTAIFFFIPAALVAAELATGWPETGGVYVWVREAFGEKLGFVTIWLQWFYNICWYPTIMSLVAATIAYLINPALVGNKLYMISVVMLVFWLATWVNAGGMKISSRLTDLAAVLGTILPMLLIIFLAAFWLLSGHALANPFKAHDLLPNLGHLNNLVLLTSILYGFIGIEMSASHAGDVENPQKDYPKSIVWSVAMILFTMVFSTLAIEVVVPTEKLNIISGMLEAFSLFFSTFHLNGLMPWVAVLIVLGAVGGAAAWMLGPSKGMLVASQDGCLPKRLAVLNKKGAPKNILLLQGFIFTILCGAFLIFPTVSAGFWVLSDVTSILALVVYIMMFSAVIRLRYKYPLVKRAFRIPGGKIGLWLVGLFGLVSTAFTIMLGFIPPSQIVVGNIVNYEFVIISGVVIGCLLPFFIYYYRQK